MSSNCSWCIILIFIFAAVLRGQSIINTVHNLSVSGPGQINATSESEICIFCHTPHNSSPSGPLWNRENPGINYTLYSSSTIQAAPGQPSGTSILCLSCHDGTIALGSIISRTDMIPFDAGISVMPDGPANLTTDLSDDHPVSILYDATLAASDGELIDPAMLSGPVRLENQRLQCTACHDAHSNIFTNFLVASTQYSDLCIYCHQKAGWETSTHKSSNATWNGTGDNPWFHTPYITQSENACESCHKPHTAGGNIRLTNYINEEDNCLICHNGNVAEKNIQTDFNKLYRHEIYMYTGVHDAEEDVIVQNRHVECIDCHNPHASDNTLASAPNVSGRLNGVRGVNSDGVAVSTVQYEFEVCYRCHADTPNKPGSPTSRQIEQNNVRLEYDPGAVSFHPLESSGQNSNVPSLLPPYTTSSIIYCSDCHGSDNTQVAGTHGSIYPRILKYQYETADFTIESAQAYELCYHCHNRDQIINSTGRFGRIIHMRHIVQENTPCNVCHDPHGISAEQGTIINNSHLINFDISVVSANSSGQLEFIDNGEFSGQCSLLCHGEDHEADWY